MFGPDAEARVGNAEAGLPLRPPRIRAPLLAIAGRADGVVTPDLVLAFRRAVPTARVVVFEKSGHLPFVEEPDRYVQLLRDFLGAAP